MEDYAKAFKERYDEIIDELFELQNDIENYNEIYQDDETDEVYKKVSDLCDYLYLRIMK